MDANSKKWKYTISKNGRHQVSEVGRGNVCALWNGKETKANGYLIAAAPEMYEMLESCLSEMYQLIDEVNDQRAFNITSATENEPDYHDHETLHLIGKLLAKARGEQ